MSERLRNNLLKYGITGVVCIAIAALYCGLRDFSQLDLVNKYRTLCDAFTIPGLVSICVGILLWASNDGAFYGLGYCLDVAWKALLPGGRKKIEKYYDYVTRHKEKQVTGFGFLYVTGGVCLAIAAVCMVLFYRIYQ